MSWVKMEHTHRAWIGCKEEWVRLAWEGGSGAQVDFQTAGWRSWRTDNQGILESLKKLKSKPHSAMERIKWEN